MTVLLDSSVLIGLAVDDHEHHDSAELWLTNLSEGFAACPTTQGAVVRHVMRFGKPARSAVTFLNALARRDGYEFWSDDLSYDELPIRGLVGHRQVTDAYLAELTRRRAGRLATFDKGQAALHADVAELVPTT